MKKKTYSKTLRWMSDVGLKAFAVLALVIGGFYAYAVIGFPPEPNATTGVVGTFVGSSEYDAPSNGVFSVASEYKEVNKYCSQAGRATPNSNLIGSHICTPDEMTNSYNHGTVGVSPIFLVNPALTPFLYINNGPPGYLASANDCGGWSRTDAGTNPQYPNYGSIWDFSQKMGRITVCTTGTKFACCK